MLYGNQTIQAYTPSNVTVWMTLAFQGGVLNVGAYLAVHQFVSHVTGYATLFGVETSKVELGHATGMLLVPILFLVGAMISAQLVDARIRRQAKPRYYIVFGLLFVLILTVAICGFNGVFGPFGEPLQYARDYSLLALLCLICGIQNGTISSVSRAVVRTTHLTGITTDLGIGLVRVINRHINSERIEDEIRANLMRVGLIICFGLGSVIGAMLFARAGYRGFLLPVGISATLFGTMVYMQIIRPRWFPRP
ncbi:MAG: DUF1275 domain-containing protein [Bdellovibrionaceae bacterium]|nr:DUF1275 domain-containing protein [Pseudobdellovibrionaceae bacterium]